LLPAQSAEEKASLADQAEEVVKGTIPLAEQMAVDHPEETRSPRCCRWIWRESLRLRPRI